MSHRTPQQPGDGGTCPHLTDQTARDGKTLQGHTPASGTAGGDGTCLPSSHWARAALASTAPQGQPGQQSPLHAPEAPTPPREGKGPAASTKADQCRKGFQRRAPGQGSLWDSLRDLWAPRASAVVVAGGTTRPVCCQGARGALCRPLWLLACLRALRLSGLDVRVQIL